MKKILRFIMIIFIFLTLNAIKTEGTDSKSIMANLSEKEKGDYIPISHQQSKAQVYFFKQALDELGATSPEQVIDIWAKGESTRNGVYHYAVACKELKKELIEKLGEPEEGYWIIGGSSPWLNKYELISYKKINEDIYEAKIKFYWQTSFSPIEITENTLIIGKNKDTWCVKEVK